MLNPVHLATLQTVLTHQSFVAAARELGYTSSAVSQQMRALERATGLELFERLPRKVRPTSAAQHLADASRETVLGLQALGRDASALAAAERGHITIGSFRTASARILPAACADFVSRRREVTMQLTEGEPQTLLPRLLDGSLDLAVAYENELNEQKWPKALTKVSLLTEDRRLLMPPSTRKRGPVQLTDLKDATWIASNPAPSLVRYCMGNGFEPDIALQTNDYNAVCAFVQAGLGVALVPVTGHHLTDTLRPVELEPRPPRREIFVLHRPNNQNPLLQSLIGSLQRAADEVGQQA